MSDAAWIFLTSALWIVVCAAGVRYGVSVLANAWEAYEYSASTFPRRRNREQFTRMRRRSVYLLGMAAVGAALGILVISADARVWMAGEVLTIEPVRIVYRFILVGMMGLLALALYEDKMSYDLYRKHGS